MFKVYQIFILFPRMFSVASRFRFMDDYGRNKNNEPVNLVVEDLPLFLTPYIENGEIQKAQELATVQPMLKNIHSFAGYITVNKTTDSNLHFWPFKSQQGNWKERPLVIWIPGGPGTSALYGVLEFVGPFSVTKQQKLRRRKYSWNKKCNLLFIDLPVGTGFSFTKMESGYARTEEDVARDLYEAFVQLYKLFPALGKNKLFIMGQSYGGKFAVTIAYKIHKMNQNSALRINIGGLMLESIIIDGSVLQHSHADYVFNLGLIDKIKKDALALKADDMLADVKAGNFYDAQSELFNITDEIISVTGLKHRHDIVHDEVTSHGPKDVEFINNTKTRKAIHVGNCTFYNGKECFNHLKNDIFWSVKPWFEELLTSEAFPTISYSGQLDITAAYVLLVDVYNSLMWPRAKEYHNANRCQFRVGNEVAGYYKSTGTFTEVMIRNTGHMVAITQPKWAYQLLDRFITNSSYFKCAL